MKEKFKSYIEKKGKWGVISDVLFGVLIVLMLIPTTRKGIMVGVKKVFMFTPAVERESNQKELTKTDLAWTVFDVNGEPISLEDLQGKVVFLNFWATWCPPCLAEMPSIQKLYDHYKNNEKITFLIVSNEGQEHVANFVKSKNHTFPIHSSIAVPPDKLFSRSIPKTFIISKQGKIVLDKTGSAKWHGDKMIEFIDGLIAD